MISSSNRWAIVRTHVLTKEEIELVMSMRNALDSAEQAFHLEIKEFNDMWTKMAPTVPIEEETDSREFANDGAGGFVIVTKSHLKQ
jgi:hypothetical protein